MQVCVYEGVCACACTRVSACVRVRGCLCVYEPGGVDLPLGDPDSDPGFVSLHENTAT